MSTSKLFEKHFGNTTAVDLKHPNIEAFFEELNAECLAEDKQKNCNITDVLGRSEELICPICGLDGFEDQADLEIHLEDCED